MKLSNILALASLAVAAPVIFERQIAPTDIAGRLKAVVDKVDLTVKENIAAIVKAAPSPDQAQDTITKNQAAAEINSRLQNITTILGSAKDTVIGTLASALLQVDKLQPNDAKDVLETVQKAQGIKEVFTFVQTSAAISQELINSSGAFSAFIQPLAVFGQALTTATASVTDAVKGNVDALVGSAQGGMNQVPRPAAALAQGLTSLGKASPPKVPLP